MAASHKLTKLSRSSLALVIPRTVIKKYGWKEHQKIAVKDMGRGTLQLRDARTKRKRPKRA
jgi:antitoxin component of MazEF toxin-antitoxin module